jgi:hypothetical protein
MVSVVIPTRYRPQLILRALRSVLAQTFHPLEVVVVVDGPDEATVIALSKITDSRLKVVTLPACVGPASARNAGVNEARGSWIAFLDDDDEWLPHKLEVQMEAAKSSRYAFPIVTSRFVARTLEGDFVWPKRLKAPSEPLSEYLFTRKPFYQKAGMIPTPTLLTNKALLEAHAFSSNTWLHEDWEWLLRVSTVQGVGIEFIPEALSIIYIQEGRGSLSDTKAWQRSLAWIRENRDIVTPRAYAGFVVTLVSPIAAREGDWTAFWLLLQEARRFGKPRVSDFLLYILWWLIPQNIRGRFGAYVARYRKP